MCDISCKHKITVVTVCYNAVRFIEKTIQSVIGQTYENMEYIIIDGGSTDGTVDVIRKYSDHISYWVSEADGGIYHAMNKGIEAATGDYINFMNAGDLFFNKFVLERIFGNETYTEDIIYGSTIGHYSGGYKLTYPPGFEYIDKAMPFCHQSSFARVSVMKETLFDLSYPRAADYVFIRDLYEAGGTFKRVNVLVSVFDEYGISSYMTLDYYAELCRAFRWKPNLKVFINRCIQLKWNRIRYSRIRFLVSSRQKPWKYFLSLDDIPELK